MQECADVPSLCGRARGLALIPMLALIAGCMQQPVELQPRSASPACEQEAKRLGFIVLEVGLPTPQPDGGDAVPILVQWGNGGAVHIRCRYDPALGATLG